MSSNLVFVDRRKGQDRRLEDDFYREPDTDQISRQYRKTAERRDTSRGLIDDYYAYMQKQLGKVG